MFSVDRLRAEVQFPGNGFHLDRFNLVALQHIQRHHDTGITAFPQTRVEIGLAGQGLTAEADNDVAGLQTGLFSRAFGRNPRDNNFALDFL